MSQRSSSLVQNGSELQPKVCRLARKQIMSHLAKITQLVSKF